MTGARPPEAFVRPVPDEPTLQDVGMFADGAPVFVEVTRRVPLAECVLDHDVGPRVAASPRDQFRHRGVEVPVDIRESGRHNGGARPCRILVEHGPRRVVIFRPGVHRGEVRADAGLVAERPRDDARVILVAVHHVAHAPEQRVP